MAVQQHTMQLNAYTCEICTHPYRRQTCARAWKAVPPTRHEQTVSFAKSIAFIQTTPRRALPGKFKSLVKVRGLGAAGAAHTLRSPRQGRRAHTQQPWGHVRVHCTAHVLCAVRKEHTVRVCRNATLAVACKGR